MSRKRNTRRRRRNLRARIYELKSIIDDKLKEEVEGSCCHSLLVSVLEEMCNLFDIPRIETFLLGGQYEHATSNGNGNGSKKKQVSQKEVLENMTLDQRKEHVRRMLGIK